MQKYDLEDRTLKFAKQVISLCKNIPQTPITRPTITQLVKSATSIGANYREANGASSRKDFRNKIYIAKKETRETEYWLDILDGALTLIEEINLGKLRQECHEHY